MPTHITQTDIDGRTILRVEGDMLRDDATLLEKIALGMQEENGGTIVIDLADLDFLDSESAAILRRLQYEHGFEIQGMEIFLQSAVNSAERNS